MGLDSSLVDGDCANAGFVRWKSYSLKTTLHKLDSGSERCARSRTWKTRLGGWCIVRNVRYSVGVELSMYNMAPYGIH